MICIAPPLVFYLPLLPPSLLCIEHTFAPLPFTSGWAGPRWDNLIAALKQIELRVHWAKRHCCLLDIKLGSTPHALRSSRKGGEEEGEEASERCLCIINRGQIEETCAVTRLTLSNMSPLNVGCWACMHFPQMSGQEQELPYVVWVHDAKAKCEDNAATSCIWEHISSYVALSCTSGDRELVNMLSRRYRSNLFCNLTLSPNLFKTEAPLDGYAAYTRGCAPFSLLKIN